MASGDLTVVIRYPDVSRADIALLEEASDALVFGEDALREGLKDLAGRIARMLQTAEYRETPGEDRE